MARLVEQMRAVFAEVRPSGPPAPPAGSSAQGQVQVQMKSAGLKIGDRVMVGRVKVLLLSTGHVFTATTGCVTTHSKYNV